MVILYSYKDACYLFDSDSFELHRVTEAEVLRNADRISNIELVCNQSCLETAIANSDKVGKYNFEWGYMDNMLFCIDKNDKLFIKSHVSDYWRFDNKDATFIHYDGYWYMLTHKVGYVDIFGTPDGENLGCTVAYANPEQTSYIDLYETYIEVHDVRGRKLNNTKVYGVKTGRSVSQFRRELILGTE